MEGQEIKSELDAVANEGETLCIIKEDTTSTEKKKIPFTFVEIKSEVEVSSEHSLHILNGNSFTL
jgi:hypothetical protein